MDFPAAAGPAPQEAPAVGRPPVRPPGFPRVAEVLAVHARSHLTLSRVADASRVMGASALWYFHSGPAAGFPHSEPGEYAVTLFILLAGIAHAAFSHRVSDPAQASVPGSYGRFLAARLWSIVPFYMALNLALIAISPLYPSALGRPFTAAEAALSTLGLSQYFGLRYASVVMWFVPFILQAYALFPLLESALRRLGPVRLMVLAWLVSTAACLLVHAWLPVVPATELCRHWSPLFRMPELVLGLLAGAAAAGRIRWGGAAWGGFLFVAAAGVLAFPVTARFPDSAYLLELPWKGAWVSAGLVVLAACAAWIVPAAGGRDPLRRLGAAAFPFFLLHSLGIRWVASHFGTALPAWIAYLVLCWALALGVRAGLDRLGPLPVRARG